MTRTVPNGCCHMVGGLRLLLLGYLFIFLTVSALMLLLPLLLEYDAEQNVWEHFNLHAMYFTQTFLGIKPKVSGAEESYGLLDPNDIERSRERLASATSMVTQPALGKEVWFCDKPHSNQSEIGGGFTWENHTSSKNVKA